MSSISRSIVAATAGIALMGLASCGGANGLAKVDPCKIMSPQQLDADGLQTQGTPFNGYGSNEPGCTFKNREIQATFFKDQTKTADTYDQSDVTTNKTKLTINGRSATQVLGDHASGKCDIAISAGGGVVIVDVVHPGLADRACAEAMQYSQQIATTLPQ